MSEAHGAGLTALEFFCGIGGFHFGLATAAPAAAVLAAFDVNPNARRVYAHNFPGTPLLQSDISRMTARDLDKYAADLWMMSPPCQPYTRNGKFKDMEDPRARALLALIRELPRMSHPPRFLIMENVEGFEQSGSRALLVSALLGMEYCVQEFVLSPNCFGFPNLRDRYFLIARRTAAPLVGERVRAADEPPRVMRRIPGDAMCREVVLVHGTCELGTAESEAMWSAMNKHCRTIGDFLDPALSLGAAGVAAAADDAAVAGVVPWVPDTALASSGISLDIVHSGSRHSCCFTKSYSAYFVGTGSVLQTCSPARLAPIPRDLDTLRALRLRFFTPLEIANLHGFPASMQFPPEVTVKQRYKLLGNSLSVTVVSRLLHHLLGLDSAPAADAAAAGTDGRT